MKESKKQKNRISLLPIIGLAVLLLLSPCKVRGVIQAELGVPQTEVSNKNQTTISTSNCSAYEVAESTLTTKTSSSSYAPALAVESFYFTSSATDLCHKSVHSHPTRNDSVSLVPLYILYQNFKVYLS